jgi:hypothetical protein
MKLKSIVYWTTTVLTAASMATSAGLYFSHNKQMKKQFESLVASYLTRPFDRKLAKATQI